MSMSLMLFFVPMCLPSTYVLDKYGLRVGMLIGFFLQALGIIIKCFLNYSFWFALIGQTMVALG